MRHDRLPFAIGVGLQSARLATIHPQPHDIPLDAVVTEAGVQVMRDRQARPTATGAPSPIRATTGAGVPALVAGPPAGQV